MSYNENDTNPQVGEENETIVETKPRIRVVRRNVDDLRLSIGSIVLVLFCSFLIVLSTFLQFNITHFVLPAGFFNHENLPITDFIRSYRLIPQIPVIIFIAAFLGRRYGIASVAIYIITGLFIAPIFALGGGLSYVFEYSFGYIMGYIPAVFFVGSILKSGFSNRNILKAVIIGVLTIHVIGILYMLFLASIKHEGWNFMSGWISAQSGAKILYDIVFSFFALFFARYARILLWFFL